MCEIDTIKNEAEAIKDRLNKQKEEIDLLIQKAKEQGEELSPDLIADFEQTKQSVEEINKRADNISTETKKKNR
jgi:seryl-tRNA synthetase